MNTKFLKISILILAFGFGHQLFAQGEKGELGKEIKHLEGDLDDKDFLEDEDPQAKDTTPSDDELFKEEDESKKLIENQAAPTPVPPPVEQPVKKVSDDFDVEAAAPSVPEDDLDDVAGDDKKFKNALEGPPMSLTDIKFLANRNGGTVVVETSAPSVYKTRFNAETNQYILEVANAKVPAKLKRPFILKDFKGAAFTGINAYQDAGSNIARIVIQLREPTVTMVQKEGNAIIVFPKTPDKPLPAKNLVAKKKSSEDDQKINDALGLSPGVPLGPNAPKGEENYDINVDYSKGGTPEAYVDYKPSQETKSLLLSARTLDEFLLKHEKFYGKPISIQVRDAGIKDVINFISEEAGLNMVVSDDVSGTITVKLRKVPWDQALILVMKSKGLGYLRQGNVIRIASLAALESEKISAKKILDTRNDTEPLQVKIIPISYASLGELSGQISAFLSPRAKVVSDNRTSSLIITDIEENIAKALALVKELDVPPYQILIEGKIVEAVESFSSGMGINWLASGGQSTISQSGGANGAPITLSPTLGINPVASSFAGTGTLNLQVGVLDVLGNLDATIGLLEKQDLAKVISSPRIITLNRESATFSQTISIPYLTATTTGTGGAQPTVNFQSLNLNLDVNPQVTSDGSVIMSVNVGRTIPTSSGGASGGATSTSSSNANTKVLVKNNQTAVVGGIYTGTNTTGENRVPVLANIPVLGWLFKGKSTERNKSELIIFVTPRIINSKDMIKKASND